MLVVCGTPHWRVELPAGWCAQHGPGNVALYHPDGVGALQISSTRKRGGAVTDADLRDVAAGVAGSDGLLPVVAGEFAGLRCESRDDREWWVRWFLSCDAIAVHVTYNCAAADSGRERGVVERVVASLTCPLARRSG